MSGGAPKVRLLKTDMDVTWMGEGRCAEIGGDLFFPEKGEPCNDAKKVCEGCEVKVPCLKYAMAMPEEFGVWGGLSATDRKELRRRQWTG